MAAATPNASASIMACRIFAAVIASPMGMQRDDFGKMRHFAVRQGAGGQTMRSTRLLAALALGCTVVCGTAPAQQGAPPPAVLVQPAELKPLAARAEFIGRVAA